MKVKDMPKILKVKSRILKNVVKALIVSPFSRETTVISSKTGEVIKRFKR